MHHFIFPNQDTWISSGSSKIDGTSFKDQNFGRDQILEVKKEFFNLSFDHPTRALVQFSGDEFTELSKSVADGTIASDAKYYLRLYEAEGNAEMTEEYTLAIQPISQSWTEGTGKFGDNPKNTNGCSWENLTNPIGGNATQWSTQTSVGNTFASGTLTISSGDFDNQEITIGGVDFVFVSGSPSIFDNNSSEIFVESGSSVDITANNLTGSINDNVSLHGLNITATRGGTGEVILSGSVVGTSANLSAVSSSNLFAFSGDKTKALEGGTNTIQAVSGNGPSILSVSHSVQTFSNQSPDVNVDVTNMVNMWLQGQHSNYGMLVRFSGSQETDETTFGHLKFFSRNTHTIFSPRLEVRWDDHLPCTGSNTGSLTQITSSGLADNFLYVKGLKESYKVGERVKFRVGARKRYIQKTFTTSVQTLTGSFIPEGSGSYAIKDVATDEFVVPFEDNQDTSYTKFSCDSNSNYFIQYLDGFYPDRVYKIQLKLKTDDGQEQIFDDDFEFIVKRK